MEIRKIPININIRWSICCSSTTFGSETDPLETEPCQFWWSFPQILECTTCSYKIDMTFYLFFDGEQNGRWRRKQTTELMRFFDSRIKFRKFGSETTIIWSFLSCYVSVKSFLWLRCINISLEAAVFWLGSFLIFWSKINMCCAGGCS